MSDLIGTVRLFHGEQRPERDHVAAYVSNLELGDVIGSRSIRSIRLRDHLVGATELVEVVDVLGAEIDLQRREQIGEPDAELLGLVAIDIGEELGNVDLEARELTAQLGTLVGPADELLRDGVERRIAESGFVAGAGPAGLAACP